MAASLASLRPTRTGSGQIRVPSAAGKPPWSRMASNERSRCCRYPMRPVTPLTTMPIDLRDICGPLRAASVVGDRWTQQPPDLGGEALEPRVGHYPRVVAARRQVDVEDADDAAGARAHHHDARAEEDGFGDGVGHQQGGGAGLPPDPVDLGVELLPGQRVQSAERLVHEQHGPTIVTSSPGRTRRSMSARAAVCARRDRNRTDTAVRSTAVPVSVCVIRYPLFANELSQYFEAGPGLLRSAYLAIRSMVPLQSVSLLTPGAPAFSSCSSGTASVSCLVSTVAGGAFWTCSAIALTAPGMSFTASAQDFWVARTNRRTRSASFFKVSSWTTMPVPSMFRPESAYRM